jgi:energy-coupling factor transporter ATP-binding protein EcfA2
MAQLWDFPKRFDKIAAFADIKDFIDRPVKTYSSGMYVRLAFASAIHVDPDIFIVDEALAVGDMFFQAKCMARMRKMMESGVTVLFVSHDTSSVKSLCQRGVFIENGELKKIGKAADIVANYTSMIHEEMNQELKIQLEGNKDEVGRIHRQKIGQTNQVEIDSVISEIFVSTDREVDLADGSHRYGEGGAKVLDLKLLNSQHLPTAELESREEFIIQASILFEQDFPTFCFGYLVRDIKGIDIIGTVTSVEKIHMPAVLAGDVYVVEMKAENMLNAGIYTLTFAIEMPVVLNQTHIFLDYINDGIIFKVNIAEDPLDRFTAKVYVPAEIKCLQINN